jgi:hypothetical protein
VNKRACEGNGSIPATVLCAPSHLFQSKIGSDTLSARPQDHTPLSSERKQARTQKQWRISGHQHPHGDARVAPVRANHGVMEMRCSHGRWWKTGSVP